MLLPPPPPPPPPDRARSLAEKENVRQNGQKNKRQQLVRLNMYGKAAGASKSTHVRTKRIMTVIMFNHPCLFNYHSGPKLSVWVSAIFP